MSSPKQPKIVIIGGGTGLPVLLRGLKKYPVSITAIVTVADDGGSSGRLRDEFDIPPPGDIRNVLAALSEVEPLIERLFQHRFENGKGLSGHSLGNLLLAAMTDIKGDFVSAIKELSKVLNVRGRVLPAANQSIVLNAEMADGSVIVGESNIPKMNKEIKRVFLTPMEIEPLSDAVEAIREADLIVICPGSLYTSILPNLLVPKIGDEIILAKAKKIYVCNLMTQFGETMRFTASDHVKVLHEHLGAPFIDQIIVNNETVYKRVLKLYQLEHAEPVRVDRKKLLALGLEITAEPLIMYDDTIIRHDTEKIASMLYTEIRQIRSEVNSIELNRNN